MNVPVSAPAPSIMEQVIIKGDLSRLTPDERVRYYDAVCRSIGVNPLTRPFEYINLSGRLVMYAKRDAADQLRKINGISLTIVKQEIADGLLSVHVRAKDRDGREDEDVGVVAFPESLKGEARANQVLKCVTKAKRRVTLSISGLGFFDETEIDELPAAQAGPTAGDQPSGTITFEQAEHIKELTADYSANAMQMFLQKIGVAALEELPQAKYQDAVDALVARNKLIAERRAQEQQQQEARDDATPLDH